MKHKIPCFCDNNFVIDAPEEIDLDKEPRYIEDIIAGNFMNFVCTGCGKKHKPEFSLVVYWNSKGLRLEVLPELERGNFYRRKTSPGSPEETVIGYPELAERIALIRDGLAAEAVEVLKLYLLQKADENYPDQDVSAWYQNKSADSLEFHLHGIKKDEVAVMKVPLEVYEKTLDDFRKNPNGGAFASLRVKTYCSIQNMLRPEELK